MRILRTSEFRKVFLELIDEIHYRGDTVILSRRGKPWIMLTPLNEDDKDLQDFIDKHVDSKTGKLIKKNGTKKSKK